MVTDDLDVAEEISAISTTEEDQRLLLKSWRTFGLQRLLLSKQAATEGATREGKTIEFKTLSFSSSNYKLIMDWLYFVQYFIRFYYVLGLVEVGV